MKVALVYKRLADTGGSERQVVLLARELAARGDEVHVFCASARTAAPPGVSLHVMPRLPLGRTLGLLAFSRWARRAVASHEAAQGPFDVRHAFGRTAGQDVYRLGGGCHRTYLEQAHALDRPAWLRPLLRRLPYQLAKLRIEEAVLRNGRLRRVITNSAMVRDDLVFRYGLAPASVRVVPNGTDLRRFRPPAPGERAALRAELALPAGAEVALFLGTGYARKGLDPALRALALVAPERSSLLLVVAGHDRRTAHWAARARDLGLADRVRFLGPRPDPERLCRAADVLLLPTAYDPAANTTVEALASGLPVVTSAANGAAEVLDAACGTVVPAPVHPGDVAQALQHWLDARRRPGDDTPAACRTRAERFPAEGSCTAILEVYRELLAARDAAAPEAR